MKVIPVIDLRRGVVVHAQKGQRADYRPLQSILCKGYSPVQVAMAFSRLGFKDLYVADLDAIIDGKPNLALYRPMTVGGEISIMVDAGVDDVSTAMSVLDSGASKLIVGTETLTNPEFVSHLVKDINGRLIISLDLVNRRLLTRARELESLRVEEVALYFTELGVMEVIVLDLARVGSGMGPDFELLRSISSKCDLRVLAGGGVRGISDLRELEETGVVGALVATSLHTGTLRPAELRTAGYL